MRVAKKLGRAGDAADIAQEALVIFYADAERWLQQPAEISRVAQIRFLLVFCLRRAEAAYFKRYAYEQLSDGDGDDPSSAGSQAEDIGATGWSGGELDFVDRIDDRNRLQRIYEAICEKLPPPRSLYMLAICAPHQLECGQVEKASGYRAGGAKPVRRSVEESWALFTLQREDSRLVQDTPRWKRVVAEIFQLQGPLGSHDEGELARAVNYIDQQMARATRQLIELMQGEEL